jgi:hypothetical protein
MSNEIEKGALASKKFKAFILTQAGFFYLMGVMIYKQELTRLAENASFMTLVATSGFLATGYILGQAALDKYIRVAQIVRSNNNDPS